MKKSTLNDGNQTMNREKSDAAGSHECCGFQPPKKIADTIRDTRHPTNRENPV
jgi:hypothetical protein